MKKLIKCAFLVAVATFALLAHANSWSYSGKKGSSDGTITDGSWTFKVVHSANADTLTIRADSNASAQDLPVLDFTGDITTTDGQKLTLVGTGDAKWGGSACANKANLTTVILPEGFVSLGLQSFKGCKALTSVTIPSTLTTIGSQAFSGCAALTTMPGFGALESITIGGSAFENCTSLTFDEHPDNVNVAEKAFSGCTGITKLKFRAGSFDKDAFSACPSLEEIEFGKGVTDIKGILFSKTTSLRTVRFLGYPSGTLYSGTLATTGDFAFIGAMERDPETYQFRICVPDILAWHEYFDNGAASEKKNWDDAPSAAKSAYEMLYPTGPTPDLYRYYNRWGGATYAWVIFEEPVVPQNVILSIESEIKVDGVPVGKANPDFGSALEYEVGSMPVCTIEQVAFTPYARFEAYGCEVAKFVEGEWSILSTNNVLSYQITDEKSREVYRLTWLFSRAYQPQIATIPTVLGKQLGSVMELSTPNVEGGYYAVGTTVSLQAVDGEAPFVRWYGASVPKGHERDNPLTFTVDGPIVVKPFFRSQKIQFSGGKISDGYLSCAAALTESGNSELMISGDSPQIPPDGNFDLTKPIFDMNEKEYVIVRSSVKFFRKSFDCDDPSDSARRIRYPKTLERNGLTGTHEVGASTTSYRFIDFGGDLCHSVLTNCSIGSGAQALSILLTIPRGQWHDIIDYPDRFTPWSALSAADRAKWRALNINGHRPVGATKGTRMWLRYDSAPGFALIIR